MVPSHAYPGRSVTFDKVSDDSEIAKLLPLVYDELRSLADRYLRQERSEHTLQATALVHEAYMRLAAQKNVHWENPAHFFGVAATFMRRILVNHAKSHQRLKRSGARRRIALLDDLLITPEPQPELLALEDALTKLAKVDARKAKMVELRYFAGLSINEVAQLLEVAPATVKRDWTLAKAWLLREISRNRNGNA